MAQVQEPYPYLYGGSFSGPEVPLSPDPLVAYRWTDPSVNRSALQVFNVTPVAVSTTTPTAFFNLDSLLNTSEDAAVTVYGPGSFRVDFGVENAAWLELVSPDMPAEVFENLTLSVSETDVQYRVAPSGMGDKVVQPVKYGNVYRLEIPGNSQLYEGVRFGFVNINWSPPDVAWHITGVHAVAQILPVEYEGSFSSQDEVLTTVWYTAAYCPKMNMLPGMLGAILMDRGDRIGWTGDDHVSQSAIMHAFGQFDFVNMSLANTADDSNSIETYALYWILSVVEYYNMTGDSATVIGYIGNMQAKLNHGLQIQGGSAPLAFVGWDERLGAGFENASCPEGQRVYSMLLIRACYQFAYVLNDIGGYSSMVTYYTNAADAIVSNLRKDPRWYADYGLHSASDGVNAMFMTPEEQAAIVPLFFNDSVQICSLSAFNQYFILQALGRLGLIDQAIFVLHTCWGGMNALGGTTYWEVFTPDWLFDLATNAPVFNFQNGWTSLCHPWASGALQWISENLLGIKPQSAGFKQVHVKPLLLEVQGSVPTPSGVVRIDVNATSGLYQLEVPEGISNAEVHLPLGKSMLGSMTDGTPLEISVQHWTPSSKSLASSSSIRVLEGQVDFVRRPPTNPSLIAAAHVRVDLVALQGGIYTLSVRVAQSSKQEEAHVSSSASSSSFVSPFPPPHYAAQVVGKDFDTQGNWMGVYGSDGYVMFGFNASGSIFKYPPYIYEISNMNPIPFNVVENDDPRALTSPDDMSVRGLGSGIGGGIQFVNFLDIEMNADYEDSLYQVSAYFCDFDCPTCPNRSAELNQFRQMGIAAYDLATRNTVAPISYITDFQNGVWVTWQYGRSMRLRFSQVQGDNPAISGLFFDKGPC